MTLTQLFNLALCCYAIVLLCSVANLFARSRYFDWAVSGIMGAANVMQLAYIVWRWVEAGRPPFSNMFESLFVFAWATVLIFLLIRLLVKMPVAGSIVLGFATALLATVILTYASAFESKIEPLVPALRSNWLTFHVLTCFIGYAAFAISFVAAITYLITFAMKASQGPEDKAESAPGMAKVLGGVMETVMSVTVAFGFIFLTIGIISGAVWANSAWGTYWSWDPKETWSLITWFVYAAFLHCRYMRGWSGWPAAVISIIGFLFVLFTYFGVNFLLSGLHSYA